MNKDCRKCTSLEIEMASLVKEQYNILKSLHQSESEVIIFKKLLQTTENKNNENAVVNKNEKFCKANYKYLSAENYRQSLVFQKKYLLKLINGYHTTDVMTITMFAKITDEPIDYHQTSLSPLSLFRSVTYAIIALCRMLYLVNQWKKVVHSYSCNSIQPATENVQQKRPPYFSLNKMFWYFYHYVYQSGSADSQLAPCYGTRSLSLSHLSFSHCLDGSFAFEVVIPENHNLHKKTETGEPVHIDKSEPGGYLSQSQVEKNLELDTNIN
ncbi:uncharacterized protein LOC143228336 [Tachypleus tridentatus]|uniref:uncharacterized protein LOC143228336 n=1 Tax=Tachypleus tridentatus TaxID=6853 RepID=UPI003FD427E0